MAPSSACQQDRETGWKGHARRLSLVLSLAFPLAACSALDAAVQTVNSGAKPGDPGYVTGFPGYVVAGEPRAAMIGKDILAAGGDAADAAVAVGLALSVTLPSRAGLGGGGVCLAYTVDRDGTAKGVPETIVFSAPPVRGVIGGDRRAAVPILARGLFLLHSRHGRLPFDKLIAPSEQLARSGVPVSAAFARDLTLVYGALFADMGARSVFAAPNGAPLTAGQGMIQPDLAGTLSQMRFGGIGDLHQGALARRVEQGSIAAGVPISLADLRAALPATAAPIVVPFENDSAAFPATDAGLASAAALAALRGPAPDLRAASDRSLSAAVLARRPGVTADAILNGALPVVAATPFYPASTSYATLDPDGNAVICALSMNNLFGTGRMVKDMGFLAAASPAAVPAPLLSVGLLWNERRHAFHAAAGGTPHAGAPLAVAAAVSNAVRTGSPMAALAPEPGRANVIFCGRYLPGSRNSCAAAADPRDAGLVTGGP